MKIDFDPAKSARNVRERGLPFELAAAVLANVIGEFIDDRRDYGEERFVAFGMVVGRLFCVVYTKRDETIRVISLRKANSKEVKRWQASGV